MSNNFFVHKCDIDFDDLPLVLQSYLTPYEVCIVDEEEIDTTTCTVKSYRVMFEHTSRSEMVKYKVFVDEYETPPKILRISKYGLL